MASPQCVLQEIESGHFARSAGERWRSPDLTPDLQQARVFRNEAAALWTNAYREGGCLRWRVVSVGLLII
jgi:hypothetical protein